MKTLLLIALLLQAPAAATSKISGRILALPGSSLPATLMLRIYSQSNIGLNVRPVAVNTDGTFEVTGVAPGEYTLYLGETLRSPGRNFTFQSGDVSDLELKLPAEISARITTVDGSTLPSDSVVVTVSSPLGGTNMRSGGTMSATIATGSGGFAVPLYPGDNAITLPKLPAGYVVRSITYGGIEVQGNLRLVSAPTSTMVITLGRTR